MKKLFILFILYIFGFCWFIYIINSKQYNQYSQNIKADAIIVLTGDIGRIQEGIEILANRNAKKLLITGVGQHTNLKDIEYINEEFPINYVQNLKDKITLGYEASNTRGNAKEASTWIKNNNFTTIFLVTSDYHMPRSIIEFKLAMPELNILPVAIHSDYLSIKTRWKLYYKIFLEYNKYLIIKFNSVIDKKIL